MEARPVDLVVHGAFPHEIVLDPFFQNADDLRIEGVQLASPSPKMPSSVSSLKMSQLRLAFL